MEGDCIFERFRRVVPDFLAASTKRIAMHRVPRLGLRILSATHNDCAQTDLVFVFLFFGSHFTYRNRRVARNFLVVEVAPGIAVTGACPVGTSSMVDSHKGDYGPLG